MSETTVFGVYYVNIKTRNQRSSEANERTVSTLTNVNANEKQTWRHKMSSERKYREKKNIEKQKYAHLESEGEPNGYRTNSFRISCFLEFASRIPITELQEKKLSNVNSLAFFFLRSSFDWQRKIRREEKKLSEKRDVVVLEWQIRSFIIILFDFWFY